MESYSVIWSPTARLSFIQVLNYLDEKWTEKEIGFFIARIEEVIRHISENPLLYPYSKESDTHKAVVVKQVSLFYRLKLKEVELLVFWDNRRDPAKRIL